MTSNSIPSRRNNNFVAESDYKAAVAAIEARFESTVIRPSVEAPEVARALIDAASKSLTANLARVVQVVSDEAYHVYKDQVKGRDDVEEVDILDKSLAPKNDAAIEYQFDESELIDQASLEKLQAHRNKAREQSAAIASFRQSILERSERLAERQVQLWKRQFPDVASGDDEMKSNNSEVHDLAIQELTANVQNMLKALRRTKAQVPKTLSTLQETTLAIQQNQKVNSSGILQPQVGTMIMEPAGMDIDPESILYKALVGQ